MEKDLKMEVFASVDTVKPVEFHVYELHAQKIGNTYSIIRGAAWKLRNWNQAGVFEDGNKIYATEKLQESLSNSKSLILSSGMRSCTFSRLDRSDSILKIRSSLKGIVFTSLTNSVISTYFASGFQFAGSLRHS